MSAAIFRLGMIPVACAIALSCARPSETPAESAAADPAGSAPRTASVTVAIPGTLNRMPSLASSGNRVAVAWTSTHNDIMNVYTAVSENDGATFSSPQRVNDKPGDVSSNAEQPPRVAISESAITIIWPSRLDGTSDIRMARSTDGGRTFSPAVTLQDASIKGARGWQGLAAGRDSAVHAVWLDGRHAATSPEQHKAHGKGGGAPRQDLYAAVIGRDGTIGESHLARDVCFCCKTAVGVGPSGRVDVVWRHIFPESMRDIAMTSSSDGGRTFGPPVRISEDKWQLSGCPDDGPAMAIDASGTAHVVWPTLVTDPAPQKAIFYTSTRDGRSFAARTRLSGGDQEDAAHPQIAADAAGNVAAVWDEQQQNTRRIAMRVAPGGTGRFDAPRPLHAAGSAFHPFVVGLRHGFLVAWPSGSAQDSVIHIQAVPAPF